MVNTWFLKQCKGAWDWDSAQKYENNKLGKTGFLMIKSAINISEFLSHNNQENEAEFNSIEEIESLKIHDS